MQSRHVDFLNRVNHDGKDYPLTKIDLSNCTLYTRTICRPAPASSFYDGPRLRKRPYAGNAWCFCNEPVPVTQEIIERDYLLVDTAQNFYLLITPYPIYSENKTLLYNRNAFQNPSFINLWYANEFLFGESNAPAGNQITFTSKKGNWHDTWNISYSSNWTTLTVDDVTIDRSWHYFMHDRHRKKIVVPVTAITPQLVFLKVENWDWGFQLDLNNRSYCGACRGSFLLKEKAVYVDDDFGLYFQAADGAINYYHNSFVGAYWPQERVPYHIRRLLPKAP